MKQYFLGIDIGTSSSKAAVVDDTGKVCCIGQQQYGIDIRQAGWSEQEPETWWNAVVESVRAALDKGVVAPKDIRGIGLSGQMHSLVALNKVRKPLYPAIIWSDQRSAEQVEYYKQTIGMERLGSMCANPVATGFTGPSLLWLKQHEPEIYEQIDVVLLAKDYVRYRMTGEIATDVTDASGTLLFDTANLCWSKPLCETLKIDMNKLPPIYKSWHKAGVLSSEAAAQTGLPAGLPVAFGGSDQPMQAVGNGVIQPGTVSVTIGTGGQVFTPVHEACYDQELRMHTFCHALDNTWNVLGATLSAGLSLNWYNNHILSGEKYVLLDQQTAKIPVGSDGLLFLPYLVGERTPHMDSKARGAFIGLTLGHSRAHTLRAVMEGVAMTLWQSMQILESMKLPVELVIASGGGVVSEVWRQILADVFDRPIALVNTTEQACVGAAIMGAVACGSFGSVEQAVQVMVPEPSIMEYPNPKNVATYKIMKDIFEECYIQNRTIMHKLSEQCS